MNLRSDSPFWLLNTPVLRTYSALQTDLKVEVAVVGAGISGALVANKLVANGHEVAIISSGHVAQASTCASTSLLQYEIDTPLNRLIKMVGLKAAIESYLLCYNSIDELEQIHNRLKLDKVFQKRKSLFLASAKKDVDDLWLEYEARLNAGIEVEWLTGKDVSTLFGLDSPAAIYSAKGAQTDAYLLTQTLVEDCASHGVSVYDKTEISELKCSKSGVQLITSQGVKITAKHVVMATGYESVNWLNRNFTKLLSTFVIISEPVKKSELWRDECLIWETARPYVYMRATPDCRIIVGGKDECFSSGHKRDALLNRKSKQLLQAFNAKFPDISFRIDYKWAGTFAETKDGLPFIGSVKEMPNVYFALGLGGNGITFSQIAANLILDKIGHKRNSALKHFGFDRSLRINV